MAEATTRVAVHRWKGGGRARSDEDLLAVEAPLEIRLAWCADATPREEPVAVTMCTPGEDDEVAVGFLFAEGIVHRREDVARVKGVPGMVCVELAPGVRVDLSTLERRSYVSSSCGVCGKTSASAIRTPERDGSRVASWSGGTLEATIAHNLPSALRRAQPTFEATGGLHAAGLFNRQGRLERLREDVGRHNAVDKLIGASLLAGCLPLSDRVLVLSGRASFELLQKAAAAGIPIVAAIGAPSSLAVEVARGAGITLLGFLRQDRFNAYTGAERIAETPLD